MNRALVQQALDALEYLYDCRKSAREHYLRADGLTEEEIAKNLITSDLVVADNAMKACRNAIEDLASA